MGYSYYERNGDEVRHLEVMRAAEKVVDEWRSNSDLYPEVRLQRIGEAIYALDMAGDFSMFAQAVHRTSVNPLR